MNYAVYNIALDIHKTGSQVALSMIRGENKRKIVISLMENGRPYKITEGCTAYFAAKMPKGGFIHDTCLIDLKNNQIIYYVTPDTLTDYGEAKCQIELTGIDGGLLLSPTFSLIVADRLYNNEPVYESSEEFKSLAKFLADLQQKLANGEFKGAKGEKGEKGENGKDAVTDQTYNPESENAQSGKAVAEAIEKNNVNTLNIAETETYTFTDIKSNNAIITTFKCYYGKKYIVKLTDFTMTNAYIICFGWTDKGRWNFNLTPDNPEVEFTMLDPDSSGNFYAESNLNGDTSISYTFTIEAISLMDDVEKTVNEFSTELSNNVIRDGYQETFTRNRTNVLPSAEGFYVDNMFYDGGYYHAKFESNSDLVLCQIELENDSNFNNGISNTPRVILSKNGVYTTECYFHARATENRVYVSLKANGETNNVDYTLTVTPLSINDRLVNRERIDGTPPLNVLVLGDSFSAKGVEQWITPMMGYLPKGSTFTTLGVVSATVRDQSNDRETYPYTSRPKDGTNNNTLSCQIEKLKRLMSGTDLDNGETQLYANPSDYPNVIIIEGGQNDGVDSESQVNAYPSQIVKKLENVYIQTQPNSNDKRLGTCFVRTPQEELDRTSFGGAYVYLVEQLNELFPDAQIFITTAVSVSYRGSEVIEHRRKVAEQQRKIADLLSIPIIDWHGESQINSLENCASGSGTENDPYILNTPSKDTNDGLHPNMYGGSKLGALAAKVIMNRFLSIHRFRQ